ncbi:MAG: hypothetical protein ACPLX7_10510 [Candidatus Kapaibacteriota bacterium]
MACKARHLFFVSLLLLTGTINGQNISKYYTSSLQGNGTLYFIFPQSGFNNNKINSKLTYDITYLTTNDTATLNFSYYDKLDRTIDSVVFICGNQRFSSIAKKIFIETKKTKWHYRYSTNLLFTELNVFFNSADNPKIILYTQQGTVELNIKAKTWKKYSSVTKKILTLIKYNQ